MSLPWDQANLLPNLQTLSRIQPGDRLSVLKDGENVGSHNGNGKRGLRDRFVIKGKFKHGVTSLIKGEKLADDGAYLDPLETLFREAVRGVAGSRSSNGTPLRAAHVQLAYEGLKRLRDGYKGDKNAKADEIVGRVRAVVAPLVCEPGGVRTWDLVASGHRFALRAWLMNNPNNPDLAQEHPLTGNDLTTFVTAVYGAGAAPQPPTQAPSTNQRYQRAGTGVCKVFWGDGIDRSSVTVNGTALVAGDLTQAAASVRNLYQRLNRDEGLLFAVSQLANQAGVASLPAHLLAHTTYANYQQGRFVPLVVHRGKEVIPSVGYGTVDLTWPQGPQGSVRLTVETSFSGTTSCAELEDGVIGSGRSLAEYAVSRVDLRIAVDVSRLGSRIDLAVAKAKLKLTSA
jgi:hypothetical protein